MAEHIAKTLEEVREAIATLEREVADKKKLANQLAELGELPAPYPTIEQHEPAPSAAVARDAFVGQPLHTAIRMYLEKRKVAMPNSAPATVNEILEALLGGGYAFDAKNEDNMKRSIRITLSKNSNTFHRVRDAYGLLAWYGPRVKRGRKAKDSSEDANGGEEEAAEEENGGEETSDEEA